MLEYAKSVVDFPHISFLPDTVSLSTVVVSDLDAKENGEAVHLPTNPDFDAEILARNLKVSSGSFASFPSTAQSPDMLPIILSSLRPIPNPSSIHVEMLFLLDPEFLSDTFS
ncbi:predicted protein [Botrytis cinerea T4]|uniref:Uncharacterized protein n=1 Tax=Botryotinia fuckeliana (strain T4) TaxID=999810 RepID=G2YEX6_BOTF4|nr:predicted protein [Botrytis cinerea T4]